jgi:hypothetical protein
VGSAPEASPAATVAPQAPAIAGAPPAAATTSAAPAPKCLEKIIKPFPYDAEEIQVWCVPACIQMVLAYYHYRYDQTFVAEDLGLGVERQEELDFTRVFDVLRAIERLSTNALDVEMGIFYPSTWEGVKQEIDNQRPAVLVGAHARVIIGYSQTPPASADDYPTNYLITFDPDVPRAREVIEVNSLGAGSYAIFYARLHMVPVPSHPEKRAVSSAETGPSAAAAGSA